MPAADALHLKVALAEDLKSNAMMRNYLDGVAHSFANPDVGRAMIHKGVTGGQMADSLHLMLRTAKTYYVSPDMTRLAAHSAEKLPNDAVVHQHHIPHPNGFMWLPEPLRVLDIRGKVLSFNAVLWATTRQQVVLWWFTDRNDPVDSANIELKMRGWDMRETPRLQLIHFTPIQLGQPLPTTMALAGQKLIPPGVKVEVKQEGGNLVYVIGDDGMAADDMVPTSVPARDARFMTVVWRLMQQTITSTEEEPLPRPLRRKLQRADMEDATVSVITLRHTSAQSTGEREIQYSHRWIVDGHWRRQWYGSGDQRYAEHIFISPFLKGPEGAPLLLRDKVSALIR